MSCPVCGCPIMYPRTDPEDDDYVQCIRCDRQIRFSEWKSCTYVVGHQEEPDPIPNEYPAVWEQVIQDMQERNKIGIERYGTPLQPFNGRRALVDAYYEILDAAVYLKQKILEEELKATEDEQQ